MDKNIFETLLGAFVLLVALTFAYISYKSGNVDISRKAGYKIYAIFDNVDGLQVGSEVKVGGVKVGAVAALALDTTYRAVVEMILHKEVSIPKDSSAAIVSSGLLGDKHVALSVGGDDEVLKDEGKITITQSSTNFEGLLAKFIFSNKPSQDVGKKPQESYTTPATPEQPQERIEQ